MSHKHGKRTHYIFGRIYFYFSFVYFGGVFNETIIPLALVEYVMTSQFGATRIVSYLSDHIQRACVEYGSL